MTGSTISSISAAITAPPPSTEPPGPGPFRPGPRSPAWPLGHRPSCDRPSCALSRPEPIKLTVPVRFNEETAAVVFPAGFLSWRLSGANISVCTTIEQRIFELERAEPSDLVDELRRITRADLVQRG